MARGKQEPIAAIDDAAKPDAGNGGPVVGVGDNGSSGPSLKSADGLTIIDPAELGDSGSGGGSDGDNSGQPVRKRRGRPAGSRTRKKAPALDINGVESILISAHTILASFTKTPELALDKEEAKQVATAVANVSRHYDVQASEKAMDWTNLFMALGMVYGTRLYAIRAKRSQIAASKPTPVKPTASKSAPNENVVEIPGVGKVQVN